MNNQCADILNQLKSSVQEMLEAYTKTYFWNTTYSYGASYGAGKIDAANEIIAMIDYVVNEWQAKNSNKISCPN